MQWLRRIRHQVTCAIAHFHLFVFATLDQACTVAVVVVHVQNVFITVAAIPLLHAHFTGQWIIFNVFDQKWSTENEFGKSGIRIHTQPSWKMHTEITCTKCTVRRWEFQLWKSPNSEHLLRRLNRYWPLSILPCWENLVPWICSRSYSFSVCSHSCNQNKWNFASGIHFSTRLTCPHASNSKHSICPIRFASAESTRNNRMVHHSNCRHRLCLRVRTNKRKFHGINCFFSGEPLEPLKLVITCAPAPNHFGVARKIRPNAKCSFFLFFNFVVFIVCLATFTDCVIRLTAKECDLCEHLFERKIVINTPNTRQSRVELLFPILKWIWIWVSYRSAISCTRSVFLASHTTTAGKWVSQSRNDVSTTKLMALCWNASIADNISIADATQEIITQINQNMRSTKWIFSSMMNRTPCNDEFAIYSFKISLKRPIFNHVKNKD